MQLKCKKIIFAILAVLFVAAFPAAFMYCHNADEAKFSEIVPALLAFMAFGMLLLAIFSFIYHSVSKGALVAILFLITFLNFSMLEDGMRMVFRSLRYWHTLPILLAIVLHIAYLIHHCVKEEIAVSIVNIFGIVFACLIAVNGISAVPQVVRNWNAEQELKKTYDQDVEQIAEKNENMPNVYLLIFDEYANFPEMEELYGYDNAPLEEFLFENGFNVSLTSHNESILSSVVQTNMVQLDYVVSESSTNVERDAKRHNGPLFEVMREHGYSVQILECGDFYGGSMPGKSEKAKSKAVTVNGESIQSLLFMRTALYPLFKKNNYQIIRDYLTIADYLCSHAKELNDTFTLAYFCLPHPPFIVDEEGREVGLGGYVGSESWSNKDYYLGQFKYTTSKLMLPILDTIVTDDPDAVIILMSDHGARGTPGATWEMKTNSLNTVYYRGQDMEIEGLSNVNTLRTVLNRLFSLDYEMVDIPITEAEE